MSVQPHDGPALALQRIEALIELGRFSEASRRLGQILASDPDNAGAWYLLAQAQLGDGYSDKALEAARRASALAPEFEWPHLLASRALYRLARYDEAADAARQAVRLAPENPACHRQLAHMLTRVKGKLSEAEFAAQRAATLAPEDSGTHMVLGVVAAAAGRRDEAAAAFQRALEIDPQNAAAQNELARLHLRKRAAANMNATRLADAATGFATAVRTDPRADVSRRNLDSVLHLFLRLTAYFIFIDAFIASYWRPSTTTALHRLLPIALLAIPAGFAARFVVRLSPTLRRYLLQLACHGRTLVAVALETIAVAALIASCLTTHTVHTAMIGLAVLTAFAGRLVLISSHWALIVARRRWSLRSTVFTLIAIALGVRVLLGVVFSPATREWLHIGSQLPTCADAGISTPAGREGTCVQSVDLLGNGTPYTVVDRGHVLRLPDYEARLLDSVVSPTRVHGAAVNPTDYPNGQGLRASFKLAITNNHNSALAFDTSGTELDLLIPTAPNSSDSIARPELLNGTGLPTPTFASQGTVAAHSTRTGWVTFIAPAWAGPLLRARPADLDLYPPTHTPGHQGGAYVGQIRLWK